MEKLEKCPYCDGQLVYGTQTEKLKYKGKTLLIEMKSEYCPSCEEGFQNDEDVKINEHTIKLAKVVADRKIAADITRIRKNLGMTQAEASEVFGGGIRAFYKYENGKVSPPSSLVILLDLIDSGKVTLDIIKDNVERKTA